MPVTIHVNGKSNSLVHKGSMGIAKSTLPDVCKTPSPGGPVPVPYPVIVSMSSDLAKGTKTVKVDGGQMAAVKGSEFSRCTGDEPGTAGGVKSSTNMKEATWITSSFDVKLDGKNACRLSDKMQMNHGNTVCLGGATNPPVSGETCPPHDFGDLELNPEGEAKRRQALQDRKSALEQKWRKNEYDADRLGPVHGDIVGGNEAARKAAEQAAQIDDLEFEERVADEAGQFSNIDYECSICGLSGDIDVVTHGGVIKECKRRGGAKRDQLEKLAKVGAQIIPGFAGVHAAVPGPRYQNMKDSLSAQGMTSAVEIQPH